MAYNPWIEHIIEHGERGINLPRSGSVVSALLSAPALSALFALLTSPVLVALGPADSAPETVEFALSDFREPSGIVYHPGRRSLFLVGDEGDIGEVSLDGRLLRQSHLGGDLEAVTVDSRSGNLYVASEGKEVISEVAAADLGLLRRFSIDRSWQGNPDFLQRGGDGIEGLTFVPNEKLPDGGSLWAVNQFDPPVLVELSIPPRSGAGNGDPARVVRVVPVDGAPLSEVTWDSAHREFLVLSALWKRVAVLDAEGSYERSVHVPGFMPEGLALLPDGRFAIAQDSGGLVVWSPSRDPFRGAPPSGPPSPGSGR